MNVEPREIDPELEPAVMDVLARGPLGLAELRVELAKGHRIVSDDELQQPVKPVSVRVTAKGAY